MSTDNAIWSTTQDAGALAALEIGGASYNFRHIPAGEFTMGGSASDLGVHKVVLTKAFWLLETPVVQELWQSVMGNNPSRFVDPQNPVESIAASDADAFVAKLNELNLLPQSFRFALPTEAQWEYACRAGSTTQFSFGDVCDGSQCNCDGNYGFRADNKGPWLQKTSKVRSYSPNAWGLYDMHGNVWEFCADLYAAYSGDDETDPTGATNGTRRVIRGGSWNDGAGSCRSAYRGSDACLRAFPYNGVRVAIVPAN